jgi:hypothetical protein
MNQRSVKTPAILDGSAYARINSISIWFWMILFGFFRVHASILATWSSVMFLPQVRSCHANHSQNVALTTKEDERIKATLIILVFFSSKLSSRFEDLTLWNFNTRRRFYRRRGEDGVPRSKTIQRWIMESHSTEGLRPWSLCREREYMSYSGWNLLLVESSISS